MKKILAFSIALFCLSFTQAQSKTEKQSQNKSNDALVSQYTCPMHAEVVSSKPGKCPKCGMELKMTKGAPIVYTCPRHSSVVSDHPGKCTQCGTELVMSKKEQMKSDVMNSYSCPMHPDVTSDKSGKCPKCGMTLKLIKKVG